MTRWATLSIGEAVVVDASALVDLLQREHVGDAVRRSLRGRALHAPAHVDAEILSAFGRKWSAGDLNDVQVADRLNQASRTPLARHPLQPLLVGAWARRENVRLVDALYVELADRLDVPLVTTDRRLARATSRAQVPGD